MVAKQVEVMKDTEIWSIVNVNSGAVLMDVVLKIDPLHTRCVFRPRSEIVFSSGCLGDVLSFVMGLKNARHEGTSHVAYDEIATKTKTKKFDVLMRDGKEAGQEEDTVGIIKFYPAWRQYCFFPESKKSFMVKDFVEIRAFICELNEQRKNKA